KLAQIMFTIDLAERLRGTGVTANALHPASLMDTAMVREMNFTALSTLDDGGEATLRLINDPALAEVSGLILRPDSRHAAPPAGRGSRGPPTATRAVRHPDRPGPGRHTARSGTVAELTCEPGPGCVRVSANPWVARGDT